MPRSGTNRILILLLGVAGFFLSLGTAVAVGGLDFIDRDGYIDRGAAIQWLAAYWLATSIVVGTAAFALIQRRKFLLTLMSVLITIAVAEAVLRVLAPPWTLQPFQGVSSPHYHHLYMPNRKMFMGVYESRSVVVATNEDGLRTAYTREEFQKYHDRVLMLGDSFVFGYGIRQDQSLTAIMERLLRERLGEQQVAVLNAGIVSASPFLERLLFAGKLKYYQPTVVVLLLDTSDIGDDFKYAAEARTEGNRIYFDLDEEDVPYYGPIFQLVHPYLNWMYNGLVYPLRLPPSQNQYRYYDFKVNLGNTVETSRFFIYRYPLEQTRKYFLNTLENINAIAEEAERIDARFVLAINPRFHHWNPKEAPNNWEKFDYGLSEPYQYEYFRFFEEVKSRVNYPIFSLLPAFQATREFPLVFNNDPHWNESGHLFAGRVLVNYLMESGMIGHRIVNTSP